MHLIIVPFFHHFSPIALVFYEFFPIFFFLFFCFPCLSFIFIALDIKTELLAVVQAISSACLIVTNCCRLQFFSTLASDGYRQWRLDDAMVALQWPQCHWFVIFIHQKRHQKCMWPRRRVGWATPRLTKKRLDCTQFLEIPKSSGGVTGFSWPHNQTFFITNLRYCWCDVDLEYSMRRYVHGILMGRPRVKPFAMPLIAKNGIGLEIQSW